MFFMLQGLVHMLQVLVQVLQGLVHMFQGLQHKMYQGRKLFSTGGEEKSIGLKKIFVAYRLGQNM
jgi:hypothetical protein